MSTQTYDKPGSVYDDEKQTGTGNTKTIEELEASNRRLKAAEELHGNTGFFSKDPAGSLKAAEDQASFYKSQGSDDPKQRKKSRAVAKNLRKRGIIGGSILGGGILGGMGLFSVMLGPMQLIHLGNILGDFGFGAQQDQDDDRVMQLLRYVRFASSGQVERTRLGSVGNKLADRFEARLNSSGLKSGYSTVFGFFDGYVIDRSHPRFRGLNDQQVTNLLAREDGVTVRKGSEFPGNAGFRNDTLVISNRDLGYKQSRTFTANVLHDAGMRKVASSIAARSLQKRGGGKSWFHPIAKADEATLRQLDKLYVNWKNRRNASIPRKNPNVSTSIAAPEDAKPEQKAGAAAVQAEANEAISDASEASKKIAAGDTEERQRYYNKTSFKLVGGAAGGLGALGALCYMQGLADTGDEVQRDIVENPAKGMAMQTIALAGQAEAGVDIDLQSLEPYHEELTGKNAAGKPTHVLDADKLQEITGGQSRGNPPSETLKSIGKGGPFDFLKTTEPWKSTMPVICSTAVQAGGFILGIITGPVSAVSGLVVGLVTEPFIREAYVDWTTGNPIDIFSRGADRGNTLAYGTALLKNDAAAATGGTPMTREEASQQFESTITTQRQEFQKKSLAYRLFNPYDYRTPVAKLIDRQTPNDGLSNIASLSSGFLNIGSLFGSNLINVLSGKSHAAPVYPDWGFPDIGFSDVLMNDNRFSNPYQNAQKSAVILESSDGQKYIDRAKTCMSVDILKDSEGKWNATSGNNSSPYISDSSQADCKDTDERWLRIRFFIKDTVNANATACFMGEAQYCADAGFSAATSTTGGGTAVVGGNAKQLAQQILDSGKVTWQLPDQETAFRQIAETGSQIANGGGCSGQSVPVDPTLLALILNLSKDYNLVLGTLVHGHDCDPGYHPKGFAVDVNGVAKGGVDTGRSISLPLRNAAQDALVREFYGAVGKLMPEGHGAMGQSDCWGANPPAKRAGIVYFTGDRCDHIHIDTRKN